MGWKDSAPTALEMSTAQARMIRALREQHDGQRPGAYAEDVLPEFTKLEAQTEIDRLKKKIETKNNRSTTTR